MCKNTLITYDFVAEEQFFMCRYVVTGQKCALIDENLTLDTIVGM